MPYVLLVDDEQNIRVTLSAILRMHGHEVAVADDGDTALEMAQQREPEILVSDVFMPGGLNGIHLAILIKTQYPDCKVLLVSGHAAAMDLAKEAEQRGHAFEVMAKPMRIPEFLSKLEELQTT
jgi:DNA-binding NtrC family response regulator